jgi:hypothetical protein
MAIIDDARADGSATRGIATPPLPMARDRAAATRAIDCMPLIDAMQWKWRSIIRQLLGRDKIRNNKFN